MSKMTKSITAILEALGRFGNTEINEDDRNLQIVGFYPPLLAKLNEIEYGRRMKEVTDPLNVATTKGNKPPNVRKTYKAHVKAVEPNNSIEKNTQTPDNEIVQ